MHCHDVQQELLRGRALRELGPTERAHVQTCRACSMAGERQRSLDALLAADVDEPVSPGFDTRMMARLAQARQRSEEAETARKMSWRYHLSWLFSMERSWRLVAASGTLAVALLVGVWLWPAQRDVPTGDGGDELALAMELGIYEEGVDLLAQLDDVEAYLLLAQLDAEGIGLDERDEAVP